MESVYFNIVDGKFQNQKGIAKAFELPDGRYELKITRRNKRTLPQNRYYWGVCVALVHEGLKDMGHEVSIEDTHDFLRSKFNYKEIVNEVTGEVERIPMSTAEMTKEQFSNYVEKIQHFAAEFLSVTIPSPNEQLVFDYEDTAPTYRDRPTGNMPGNGKGSAGLLESDNRNVGGKIRSIGGRR